MQTIHCEIHNLNILIFNNDEQSLFVDDNEQEAVIFIDEKGNKKLKRFVINKCDENCKTVKEIIGE